MSQAMLIVTFINKKCCDPHESLEMNFLFAVDRIKIQD